MKRGTLRGLLLASLIRAFSLAGCSDGGRTDDGRTVYAFAERDTIALSELFGTRGVRRVRRQAPDSVPAAAEGSILRLAGGDLNALLGGLGFVLGILAGVFFLKKGYSLKRSYSMARLEGFLFPAIQVVVFILLVAAPAFIYFTEAGGGPGAKHAAVLISLAAGLIVGALAQRTRLCMVGGIRDVVLFREPKLLMGFGAILVSALVCNLILNGVGEATFFHLGFKGQPIAHTDGLWNCLGMLLVGFGCVLLGGCPLRQLVMSGEGNSDSAVTVLGLIVGAAFCHNFGLASSADGPTAAGKIAVLLGIAVVLVIACLNTFKKK